MAGAAIATGGAMVVAGRSRNLGANIG
jgi:hypothetical protein